MNGESLQLSDVAVINFRTKKIYHLQCPMADVMDTDFEQKGKYMSCTRCGCLIMAYTVTEDQHYAMGHNEVNMKRKKASVA